MMPDWSIRIIYPASIFLIRMLYFTINSKQKINDIIFTVVGVFALLTTVTKSLFLGIFIGSAVY